MIEKAFENLYWPAIVVAGVGTFLLGGVWYHSLFGKLWVRLHGYSAEQQAAIKAKRPPALFLGGMIVGYTALAWVVAVIANMVGASTAGDAVVLGGVLWLVLTLGASFTTWLARGDHIGTLVIDAAYQLVFIMGMAVTVVVWRA